MTGSTRPDLALRLQDPPVPAEADPTTGTIVAAFDLDGTLTRGGSVLPFLAYVRGVPAVLRAAVPLLPFFAYAAVVSGPSADRTKERLFTKLLGGLTSEELIQRGIAFAHHHLSRRLRHDTAARLYWHRQAGHQVVVVSASPDVYVAPLAGNLGASGVVATHLEVDGSGYLTGRYKGSNCRGRQKVDRLEAWLAEQPYGRAITALWAYGNSRGDLALLERADFGIDAGRLGRLGRLRRFPTLKSLSAGSADEVGWPGSDRTSLRFVGPGPEGGSDAD